MIIVKDITAEAGGETLFESVSFSIAPGEKIGIVGPNGSGKTTLLKILSGELKPESGSIDRGGERIGYLPQSVPVRDGETVEAFLRANLNSVKTWEIFEMLGLRSVPVKSEMKDLSGGQRARIALAKLLLTRPTALILDEPTNHLDFAGLAALEEFVNGFPGTIILVSHDRRFLDNTVSRIFELDKVNQSFLEYAGGYSDYVSEKAKRLEKLKEEKDRQDKLRRKMEQWIALKKQEATNYDDPAKGKQIRAMERRLEREVIQKEIFLPKGRKSISPTLSGAADGAKLIVKATNIRKSFGERPILRDASFEIRGGERVALFGANGSGKTTLFKIIAGEIEADEGEIRFGNGVNLGYFSQHQEGLRPERTVIEEFLNTERLINPALDPKKILGSFLFSGREVNKKVADLSFGERVRLSFAKFTNQRNELLILDEPTNHLDIPSREAIESALLDYAGALLIVSHDRYFIEKINPVRSFLIEAGVLREIWE